MTDLLESLPAIYPLHFFSLSVGINHLEESSSLLKNKFLLPDTAELLGEERFATCYMAWNQQGISLEIDVHKPLEDVLYPDFRKGDSIELFFDTRDLKTAGFPTRFCHHFVILPKEVQGIKAQEISKFRAEDTHALCDPEDISAKTVASKKGFVTHIHMPSSVLHGFDPTSFDRLGFNYRINRSKGLPQHFAISSKQYLVEQQSALWASLKLMLP
ncbi:MAG: hypothetical protein LVR00_06230 [Rhabdochlamydiaceae bacterium]|jgi:hypothetical protein